MNSRIIETDDGEEIVYFDGINLGLAAQTDRGLVVPAIAHAEQLSARELFIEINDLVDQSPRWPMYANRAEPRDIHSE